MVKSGVKPRKRVAPDAKTPAKQRKLIYRMRYFISKWSNRTFALARQLTKAADLSSVCTYGNSSIS